MRLGRISGSPAISPISRSRCRCSRQRARPAAVAESEWKQHCSLKTQRTLKDFKNKTIEPTPELEPDPSYQAGLREFPDRVEGDRGRFSAARSSWRSGITAAHTGDTDEEVIRTLFFHWYLDNRKKHGLRWYTQTPIARVREPDMTSGECRYDITLQPISGKAIPLYVARCCASFRSRASSASTLTASTFTITRSACRSGTCGCRGFAWARAISR